MKAKRDWVLKAVAGLALPALCFASISDANAARPPRSVNSAASRTGPAGNTSTRQTNVATNGQGGYTSNTAYTGKAGNTSTRTGAGSYDASTKTYNRSATTAYPNGKQSSVNASVRATGNGYQRNATRTGPNGGVATSQGQATYDASTGTLNQSRTTTGPNGKSATENRTVTVGTQPQN